MQSISNISVLRTLLNDWRKNGQTIAIVPTMGNLHAGHLNLVEYALAAADRVVLSIFVNPLQFGANEDYLQYPRTLDADREQLLKITKLKQVSVDVLFTPTVADLYPRGQAVTRVIVPELSEILCGVIRPGHFVGVATVVNILFNIVQPDKALFGEKDYQQLLVIKRMVTDLLLPTEIIGRPTVRETDGLAMSSRNSYLSVEQRALAPRLFQVLSDMKRQIEAGAYDFALLENQASATLSNLGFAPDYVAIRQAFTLAVPKTTDVELVLLAAARLGKTRLIDNVRVKRLM
ncbi:MAG: pantoate--beta-alanine ligase [Beggiatoa sp. IS2]|nr:MAG: pantoate--beta-alanine ligase [Beggiatoa sp. IS2]